MNEIQHQCGCHLKFQSTTNAVANILNLTKSNDVCNDK